jgi:hypothetical protein
VVGQEGRGDCELISGVVFCISFVTMAWENSKLKISMVGTVPTRKLIHTKECLPRVSGEGHWEEFVEGNWIKTLRAGRCQTIPLEKTVKIICKDRLVVRDSVGGIHTLGNKSTDILWSLLPAQSVDATWSIGVEGIVVDDQADWDNRGGGSYITDEEEELRDFPLDDTVLEQVVIGLGTINGALLTGGTALLITFCCWKNRRKLVESAVSDDELGDVARAETVNDTEAGGIGGPSRWRSSHGGLVRDRSQTKAGAPPSAAPTYVT